MELPHRYTRFASSPYSLTTHFTVSITRFSVGHTSGPLYFSPPHHQSPLFARQSRYRAKWSGGER